MSPSLRSVKIRYALGWYWSQLFRPWRWVRRKWAEFRHPMRTFNAGAPGNER